MKGQCELKATASLFFGGTWSHRRDHLTTKKIHRQSKVDRRWKKWESDGIWPGPNRVLHWCFGLVTVQYVGIHFSLVLSIKVNIPNLGHPTESHRSPTGFQVTQVWQSHAFCTKFAARHHNNKSQEITWGTFLCDLYHNYRFRSDKSHLDRLHGFCDWGNSEIRDPQPPNHHPERALNHLEGRYPKSLLGMVNDKHQKNIEHIKLEHNYEVMPN